MYERFTTRARKVLEQAEKAAADWNCDYIGTVHILWGLIQDGGDLIVHALKNLGIDLDQIQQEIEKNIDKAEGTMPAHRVALSPGAKSALSRAILESEKWKDPIVGVEHLLLGLLHEKEGVATKILRNLGVEIDDLRNEILLLLDVNVQPKAGSNGQLLRTATDLPTEGPIPRCWTREEYHRMAELGLFRVQRTELIEGEIMLFAQEKPEHSVTVARVHERLKRVFEDSSLYVSARMPLALSFLSEPAPDVSIVSTQPDFYSDYPSTALLVIEVSDRSLDYDRTRKASLYARAGIADYWIINLANNQLEVYRDPRPDPYQPYGRGYGSVTTLVTSDFIQPLAEAQVSLAVAELLP